MNKAHLTQHQEDVFKDIMKDIRENIFSFSAKTSDKNILSLTGPAGTGKSFLTTTICKTFLNLAEELNHYPNHGVCLTAPTHKAVKVLHNLLHMHSVAAETKCKTIHAFLGLKLVHDYANGIEKYIIDKTIQKQEKASLLIIDESSMIASDLYGFIKNAIAVGNVNTVLFIGDKFQLPPVNEEISIVFNLKKQYQLTEIVRQAQDSPIIKLASKIRERIKTQDFIPLKDILQEDDYGEEIEFFEDSDKFIQSYYHNENWHQEDKVVSSYTNKQVDKYNSFIRDQFWKEKGVRTPNYLLSNDMVRFKDSYTIDRPSRIRNPVLYQTGEEVMLDKVEYIDQGGLKFWKCTVVGRKKQNYFKVIDPDSTLRYKEVLAHFRQLAKRLKFPHNKKYWKDYFRLKNAFAEVQFVYSSTIHKLQGSTYDEVYINLASLLNNKRCSYDLIYRLSYVAITRGRSRIKVLY